MNEAPPPLYGLVLAGGRSSRMGRDKAAVIFAGETMLERAVELLQRHLSRVVVSARAEQSDDSVRRHFELISDEHQQIGPAAGIVAAHQRVPDAAWLVLACDMPGVSDREIEALIEARDATKAATAFVLAEGEVPEPLCTIYEPGTLADFAARIAEGGNPSPKSWLAKASTCMIVAKSAQALRSVNTEDDLSDLDRRI